MDLFKRAVEANSDAAKEKELCDKIKAKVDEIRASASRVAHESIWMTNVAYLLGYPGITFNSQTRSFQPINRASSYLKKNRVYVNNILPTLQNRLARLTKSPPKYDVRPESNDTEDKEAARLGLQVLTAMWEKMGLDEKRFSLYMWLQECGHSYMKVSWDDSLGKPMVDPVSGELSYEGDVRGEVLSAFEIFPDPQAKCFDDILNSYCFQCKVRSLDYFRKTYPEKGHLVKPEDVWLLSLQYEQRINTMNNRGPLGSDYISPKNSAVEIIKYEARSKKYPNGRMIVTANGVLLEDKELPTGEIPLAKFDDIVIGGKYYSESVITHLRPVEDQMNANIQRRAAWTNRLLAGKYAVARGAGLTQESLTDQSGEILFYDPVPNAPDGGRPAPMQVPMIPQYSYMEDDRLEGYFNSISGLSEVSRGTLPSAQVPAVGMALLVEQDETRIGVMTEQHERAWARVGSLILKYVEKYYKMPRKIKIVGKSSEYMVKDVSGDMLKGNTDVFVVKGSTSPGSKVVKRQDIINLYNQGLLGDPADPKVREKVLQMLEFGDVGEAWADYSLDMSQIKRGTDTMESGVEFPVSELDNHALWIQELNRYRKQEKFSKLPEEIQNLFLENIEIHLQYLMEQTGQAPQEQPIFPDQEAEALAPKVEEQISIQDKLLNQGTGDAL